MINRKIFAAVVILALSISLATAEESRNHQFSVSDISLLSLNIRAGTIVVENVESDSIDVEVKISEDEGAWFRRSIDIEDMDIQVEKRGTELGLSFNQKGVTTDWVLRIPTITGIEINSGIGTVSINMAEANIDANIGIGTIELELSKAMFGNVELASGVGDTSAKGANSVELQRALVSSNLTAQGDGDLVVRANVGIGSVEAELL